MFREPSLTPLSVYLQVSACDAEAARLAVCGAMAGLVAAGNVNTHPLHDTATPDQELAVAAALYPVLASVCNHRSVHCQPND